MDFELWRWSMFALAALIIGLSKSGVPGLGILNVAIFQILLDAKDAVGFGLPLLIMGDFCSLLIYRRHAEWKHVLRLVPWAVIGVIAGWFTLGKMDGSQARLVISLVLAAMLALHAARQRWPKLISEALPHSYGAAASIGVIAAFVSTLANAAGPIMILFLLAMRLPKMAFMGTSVYFFTFLNLFKVPFLHQQGLVNWGSLEANLKLAPFVAAGSLLGYFFARKISQNWFERIAFWLTVVAVAYMLYLSF
ncbi:sulfite exporter TauE/SafE family protein [Pelagicoccus sp. SDUM812003]|uniref:sulfite exporter TauE/SafE family protein n=1 Tax=Pelagicoccus sp. SDUM812003 TaxID=3041267 RepID=UPI00280E5FF7|nr:sulfite exporter TauE/SafE family protein [Pelagicoccus sp. SDUM812003]MDQ8205337.1 sulfite exporter TauE/SafE family protein [Pelagicoccus sp. SDUM812003]